MRHVLRSVGFLFVVSLASKTAIAQPHPAAAPADVRSQLPDPARRAWDSAKQLADANDYKGALVEFQRAYDLSQNPRVLYNLGVVEKFLTHYARATSDWQRELTEGAGKLTPAEVSELNNAISVVQKYIGTIEVTANEADATLVIDDYTVGKTPFTAPVPIEVGTHAVKLSKDGFISVEQQIQVAAGQK
jgi:tetratricopeptide (TPR) repeat protein